MENQNLDSSVTPHPPPPPSSAGSNEDFYTKMMATPITNENDALNMIINFLLISQKRGVYSFEESAKILECIKKFQRK